MKLGAEPKKLAILGGLVLVAGVVFFMNSGSDTPPQSEPNRRSNAAAPVPDSRPVAPASSPAAPNISQAPRIARGSTRGAQEFRPSLKPKRPEDRVDPMKVDPTLRLDLLAKVQDVKLAGVQRSLFDFSQAPPPKTQDVKVVPKPVKPGADAVAGAIASGKPADPVKPPAPPIPLKFYGFINPAKAGAKRAFFIEGDEIFVASEGDLIKKRYKVVRIGVNSVVVEDVQFQHQQTIPLEEQPA